MSLIEQFRQIPKSSKQTLLIIFLGVGVVAFLAGFIPMWIKVHGEQRKVANLEREAVLMELENSLGAATIEARGGRYEDARQEASVFFTDLRSQLDRGKDSAIPPGNWELASTLLKHRDELITLLARGDPAGADRLASLYVAYRDIAAPTRDNSAIGARSKNASAVGGSP